MKKRVERARKKDNGSTQSQRTASSREMDREDLGASAQTPLSVTWLVSSLLRDT